MFKHLALFAFVSTLSLSSAMAAPPPSSGMPPQPKVRPQGIPEGFVMVSPCVRGMGEHWANLQTATLPGGAIDRFTAAITAKSSSAKLWCPSRRCKKVSTIAN